MVRPLIRRIARLEEKQADATPGVTVEAARAHLASLIEAAMGRYQRGEPQPPPEPGSWTDTHQRLSEKLRRLLEGGSPTR
jgi:hypothetical protein